MEVWPEAGEGTAERGEEPRTAEVVLEEAMAEAMEAAASVAAMVLEASGDFPSGNPLLNRPPFRSPLRRSSCRRRKRLEAEEDSRESATGVIECSKKGFFSFNFSFAGAD